MPVLGGFVASEVDVAVIGAGAAGIGAARALMRLRPDLSLTVIEASGRIGGRAHTLPGPLGIDLGCGWLHGAQDNAWTTIAEELGFVVDRTRPPWGSKGRKLGLSRVDQEAATAAMDGFFDRVDAHGSSGPDLPLSAFLEPGNRWNGMVDAVCTYINGAPLDRSSTVDYQRYAPGRPPDWRVPDGYGRLVATYGAPAPVVLDTPARRVRHGGARIAVETDRGTLHCRAAAVTVSSTLLATEAIRFDPPLPDKLAAAAGLPLGLANKLYLEVRDPEDLPQDAHLLGSPFSVRTGAYQTRPFGRPIIEGYYGGPCARDLEAAGPEAAFAFACDELAGHFGNAVRERLTLHAFSAWAADPWARGSYSYAEPGKADGRAVLAAPVDDRLFFAGEACSLARFSTAHGAFETGVAAAKAISSAL